VKVSVLFITFMEIDHEDDLTRQDAIAT